MSRGSGRRRPRTSRSSARSRSPTPIDLAPYVRDRGLPNVLDFPLQDAAAGFVAANSSAKAVANRLADDDYFRLANGVDPAPPTFLGNHDMGRAAQQIRSRMQPDDGALLQRTLLGYDLLYVLRGAPVVYYGDEVGMIGSGGDKAAREDMFPTQVEDWQTEPRVGSPPIGNGSSFDVRDNPIELRLKQLAALRDSNPALATGPTIVRRGARAAARRLPDRHRRTAGVRRRAQRGNRARAGDRADGDALVGVAAAARRVRWRERRRRLAHLDGSAALDAAASRGRARSRRPRRRRRC